MTSDRMSDEAILKALPSEFVDLLSAEHRAALDRVLARLAAAERVCELVGDSLSPKARAAQKKGQRVYWWDVAGAVKDWEKLARP